MNITVLCENQVAFSHARLCKAEWGLSLLVEHNYKKVLLDTGHTDIYWRNARNLKIDLQAIDALVLSHFHWDHVGGLKHHQFKQKKRLIAHPDIFEKLLEQEKLFVNRDFKREYYRNPFEFLPNIYFLGEIPRTSSFELGVYKNEPMLDDTAIAIKTTKGVVVITGCSHSGICNICEQAKKVAEQELYAVIGGFHLMESDMEAVEGTLKYFEDQGEILLYPMHCVDFATMTKFRNLFNIDKMSTGDKITLIDT